MKPDGETTLEMGRLLSRDHDEEALRKRRKGTKESDDYCEHQQMLDYAICDNLFKTKGARTCAICMRIAHARYAACLNGTPIYALPQLFKGDPD